MLWGYSSVSLFDTTKKLNRKSLKITEETPHLMTVAFCSRSNPNSVTRYQIRKESETQSNGMQIEKRRTFGLKQGGGQLGRGPVLELDRVPHCHHIENSVLPESKE